MSASLSDAGALKLEQAVMESCSEAFELIKSAAPSTRRRATKLDPSIASFLLPIVYAAMAKFTSAHNARQPIARLPVEVLCAIFARLPVSGRLRTAMACRTWRNVSLSSPAQVWSSLRLPSTRPEGISGLLARSGSVPVQLLQVDISAGNILGVAHCIEAHMHRLQVLHINVEYSDDHDFTSILRPLMTALCVPAPLLEHFALVDGSSCLQEYWERYAWTLFGERAPRLRSMKFYGRIANLHEVPESVFSQVKEVLFASACPSEIPLDASDIRDMFEICPQLETLAIQIDRYRANVDFEGVDLPIHLPPTLSTLVLVANCLTPLTLLKFLQDIRPSRRTDVHILYVDSPFSHAPEHPFTFSVHESEFWDEYYDEGNNQHSPLLNERAARAVLDTCDQPVVSFSMRAVDKGNSLALEVACADGHRLLQSRLPCSMRPSPATLEHATSLHISEVFLRFGPALPPAPQLQSLTTYISLPGERNEYYDAGSDFSFIDDDRAYSELLSGVQRHNARFLQCPRLQRARFVYALETNQPSPPLPLFAGNVVAFLRARLSYGTDKLATIALAGFHLEPSYRTTLLEVADEIWFDPLPELHPPPFADLLSWEA